MQELDLLAIAAHRDDVELTCGGTMIKSARQGYRTGVLDLTEGETGTRGDAETRRREAEGAAAVLGVALRENLGLPDAAVVNTPETRVILARAIRRLRPRVIIAPASQGRHPDHRATAELVRDACFIAGLQKVAPDTPPFRPVKVIHATAFREDWTKPSFLVDITGEFEEKLRAIMCYESQFSGATRGGEVQPNGEPLADIIRHQAAHYGSLIRCQYAEPFHTTEAMKVQDVVALDVATF